MSSKSRQTEVHGEPRTCHTTNMLVKDKHGTLLTSEGKQERCWMEQFTEVLNRPLPSEVPKHPGSHNRPGHNKYRCSN